MADPGNVGTLLRTADAFGAAVALSAGCADPLGAEGAARVRGGDLPGSAAWRSRTAPKPRIALAAHGGRPLHELELVGPVTFLLGAERDGLPDELVAQSHEVATIPTPGAAESLNVAAAGAIALYERSRRA